MTRAELRASLNDILASGIDEAEDGGPNMSQLRKASRQLDLILAAVDKYAANRA